MTLDLNTARKSRDHNGGEMHYQFTLEIRTGILTHLLSIFPFDPPENIGFSDVSMGIKREHKENMV